MNNKSKKLREILEAIYPGIIAVAMIAMLIPAYCFADWNGKMTVLRIHLDQTAELMEQCGYVGWPGFEEERKEYGSVHAVNFSKKTIAKDEEYLKWLNEFIVTETRLGQIDDRLVEIQKRMDTLDTYCAIFHSTYKHGSEGYQKHYADYEGYLEERDELENECCLLLIERVEVAERYQELAGQYIATTRTFETI